MRNPITTIEDRFDGLEKKIDDLFSPLMIRLNAIENAIAKVVEKAKEVDTVEYEPTRVTENDEAAAQRESA